MIRRLRSQAAIIAGSLNELNAPSQSARRPSSTKSAAKGYVRVGVEELDQEKLTPLLRLRYQNSIADALADLGRAEDIGRAFAGFQQYLYQPGGSGGDAHA